MQPAKLHYILILQDLPEIQTCKYQQSVSCPAHSYYSQSRQWIMYSRKPSTIRSTNKIVDCSSSYYNTTVTYCEWPSFEISWLRLHMFPVGYTLWGYLFLVEVIVPWTRRFSLCCNSHSCWSMMGVSNTYTIVSQRSSVSTVNSRRSVARRISVTCLFPKED